MFLIKITLHVNMTGQVTGGGYAGYDLDGDLLFTTALADFPCPTDLANGAQRIVEAMSGEQGIQLRAF